ncbi:rna-binding protein nob1 [Holotrichia oblita]|uniref:Rna-binding protein nob1 n=1 Tax=Holotrichia oblita TaxID=644536 RepID=A0ACB9TCP9_HOLOL|nr:rna-binding protein nob1 [Holotrichia oblita]
MDKKVDYLIVDTTAFIENAPLQNIARNIVTTQEVVDEITDKRQLRRLVVLPYDLIIKDVFPKMYELLLNSREKTGDYPNLSATDIKVMALTYQLEKAEVGIEHLRKEPIVKRTINVTSKPKEDKIDLELNGFYMPKHSNNSSSDDLKLELEEKLNLENAPSESAITENTISHESQDVLTNSENDLNDILPKHEDDDNSSETSDYDDEDDDAGWITPSNIKEIKKQINSSFVEEKAVKVACITTDFAMQNVLKQMNLNVSALDGRIIKELKTYILRCYTCFKTTSIMTQKFCPKCGNATLKRTSVNRKREKFSLPTVHGGKHSNNPILSADQQLPDQKPTRLARTKNNPLGDDYIAGYSPFVMRDVNSKSAQLGIRNVKELSAKTMERVERSENPLGSELADVDPDPSPPSTTEWS